MTDARPILAVSLAMFRDDGRVLLAQRGDGPMAALWSLPGGKVEFGETLTDAALREMREEVGATAEIVCFNRHVDYIRRDGNGVAARHYVIASFVGRWIGGEPRPGPEAVALEWVDPFDPGDRPMTDELPSVLRQAAVLMAKADLP